MTKLSLASVFAFLTITSPLAGVRVPAQIRLAPVTSIGENITCHVGADSYQLKPNRHLLSRIRITGETAEMQKIFDKVVNYTDLTSNVYTIPVEDDVNMEICPGEVNYIAYNARWLKALYAEKNNIWVLYAVIAHEIGHYARGHDKTSLGSDPKIELEADKYAGETLARMGASLEEAQAAFRSENMKTDGHTHPPIEQRIAAVAEGWRKISGSRSEKPARLNIGKTTIGSTGYIAGLKGRLNPILDDGGRTYLYADNIAIEGGQIQPVKFILNQPFAVEDSVGNRLELRISSITKDSATIEYSRLPSLSDKNHASLSGRIVDEDSQPVSHAQLLAVFSDGTYLEGKSDSTGKVKIQGLKERVVSIYCAHEDYAGYYKSEVDLDSGLVVELNRKTRTGSIIVNGTGYIPGLTGRLNPILDSANRRYLYADKISIGDDERQPANFDLNRPFQVEDANGKRFELTIVAIRAASSLINFTRLN